ncbi:MAG TPA: Wzz/FepE/Etk N-terminal domain-containing protein [Myxococcota bacterium]|nr:Wzz/FepE/Etk N-terminal domain-containing protein [Myxococcota bacterium]
MNVDGDIQLGDFAGILRRRGKLAGLTALGVVLVAYWVAMALPNIYTSYATVLVEPQSVNEKLVQSGVQDSDINERLHIMSAQILSRPRLSAIIDKVGLYKPESSYMLREEIINLMRSRIRVEPVIPELERQQVRARDVAINEFQIFFDDYDAKTARDVAQLLANDFIESHIDSRVVVSQKGLEFIQGELARLAEQIQDVEGQIAKVKNDNSGKLPEDLDPNQRRLERILGDRAIAQREMAEATSDEGFYRSQVAQAAAFSAPNDDASPARRLDLLKLTLTDLRSRGYTEKHPDIVKTKAEIEELEKTVSKLKQKSAEEPSGNLVEQQAQASLKRATLRREQAQAEIERLQDLADEVQGLINATPAVTEQLDALKREYEHLFTSFQDFSKRQLEASVQAQLERRQLGEQFRVIEAAFIAPGPSSPHRAVIIVLGAVFGIFFGAGVGLLLEVRDRSPHDARQLQARIELPVLATIPQIWLEGDRVRLRRRRLREAIATSGVVLFALVGGAANYMWVNGMPGFLRSSSSSSSSSPSDNAAPAQKPPAAPAPAPAHEG